VCSERSGEDVPTVMVDSNYRGWIDINVTDVVTEWTQSPASSADNHRLFLRVSSAAQPGQTSSSFIVIKIILSFA